MYFSRLFLKSNEAARDHLWRHAGNVYQLHQQVWNLFEKDPEASRDFLYRFDPVAPGRPRPRLWVVSRRPPQTTPELREIWQIDTKDYDPDVRAGDVLRFSLRATPAVAKNGARHDVVMDRRVQLEKEGVPRSEWPTKAQMAHECGMRWLERRSERLGFSWAPDSVLVSSYLKHRFRKGSRVVRLSSCDFDGRLKVEDPVSFRNALFSGVGPAKGFGFGLLLCARAS